MPIRASEYRHMRAPEAIPRLPRVVMRNRRFYLYSPVRTKLPGLEESKTMLIFIATCARRLRLFGVAAAAANPKPRMLTTAESEIENEGAALKALDVRPGRIRRSKYKKWIIKNGAAACGPVHGFEASL
jgi:hypothetical protein